MIDAMFQEGTDAALDDQVRRPTRPLTPYAPPKAFDPFEDHDAAFRGIGGGVAHGLAFGAEVAGAFGQMVHQLDTATPEQRRRNDRTGLKAPVMSNEAGDVLRTRAAEIMPDPRTASTSAQMVAGLSSLATRAALYSLIGGPAAPYLFGFDTALEEADKLRQQGVDLETRTKAGAVVGTLNAIGLRLPMGGATALSRFAIGAAGGEATMVGQTVAERAILRSAGYDKIAEAYDPLDPVALALGVVPGVIGAAVGGKPRAARPRPADLLPELEKATPEQVAAMMDPQRIPVLEAEIAKPETTARERAKLQRDIDAIRRYGQDSEATRVTTTEPDLPAAIRVAQVDAALDRTRLTPDQDLVGRDEHVSAVAMASDQIAAGERVRVADVLAPSESRSDQVTAAALAHTKVVDEQGMPLRVFHGTDSDVRAFDPARTQDGAFHFTSDPEQAGQWATSRAMDQGRGANVIPAFLDLRNPKVVDMISTPRIEEAKAAGHDGIVAPARGHYVAFQPDQVHSAIGHLEAARPAVEQVAEGVHQLRAVRQSFHNFLDTAPSSKGPGEAPARSQAASKAEGQPSAPSAVTRAVAEIEKVNPDMLVQLEGMDAPMKVSELLARVKEEAAQDVKDGSLLQVAAECALRS